MSTNVGIVGIGKMGLPVALSLLEHGFAVYGYRRHMIDDFITMGGTAVSSSKEVAQHSLERTAGIERVVGEPDWQFCRFLTQGVRTKESIPQYQVEGKVPVEVSGRVGMVNSVHSW